MNRSLTALLLITTFPLLFSHQAFANRPAMAEVTEVKQETEETVTEPNAETLSSVDIIMQQETRQTGDVLQLPAEEVQPGDVIRINCWIFPVAV